MLVLSRKQDQEIVIGDQIRIRVLKIKGNTIRLGIDAPQDVKVVRGELPLTGETDSEADELCFEACRFNDEAEFTVVFDTQNQVAKCEDVVQFRSNHRCDSSHPTKAPANNARGDRNGNADYQTVSFRQPLPSSLQHNRLKELVKSMTRGK